MAATRRRLLGSGTVAAAAGLAGALLSSGASYSAATVSGTDAELIALCSRFDELQRRCDDTCTRGPYSAANEAAARALRAPWEAEQDELFERIISFRATTLAGFRARARMLLLWDKEVQVDGEDGGCWDDRMTWALLRDMTAEAA